MSKTYTAHLPDGSEAKFNPTGRRLRVGELPDETFFYHDGCVWQKVRASNFNVSNFGDSSEVHSSQSVEELAQA